MKKYKRQLFFLGCSLVLTACGGSGGGGSGGGGSGGGGSGGGGSGGNSSSFASPAPASTSPAQRIAGLDTNNNGVRDDVGSYINTRYLVASQKAAALQMARVIQRELLVSKTDKAAIKLVLLAQSRAVSCVYLKFDSDSPIKAAAVVGDIESVTANTKERRLAYLAFSKAADGTTSTIPEGDTCD